MFINETFIRVRYGETDQMGYVYYGIYAQYYEVGRVEMIRSLGLTYKDLELGGVMMPVLSLKSNYHFPARYDDLLKIKTLMHQFPGSRINFTYEIYNEKEELVNTGDTTLFFVKIATGKPCPPPKLLLESLKPKFILSKDKPEI